MKKQEGSQIDMSSSSFFQRIKDGIVSPLALKLGIFTAFQPAITPVNNNSCILKLQKYMKAQVAEENEEISKLEEERKIMMQELAATKLKIQASKYDCIEMKMEVQKLECELQIEENQNKAVRQEIIRIEREKQQQQQQNLYDEEDQGSEENEDHLHQSLLGLFKQKQIDKNLLENGMNQVCDIVSSNLLSFQKRLNLNRAKLLQIESEEDLDMEMQEVD